MNLGRLIEFLEALCPDYVLPLGIKKAHSYRGYYDRLAFEPAVNVTARQCLECARAALNAEFRGYKGGWYRMTKTTPVYLAEWGELGQRLLAVGLVLDDRDDGGW